MRKSYIQRIILTTLFLSLVYIPNAIYAKSYGEAPMLAKMVLMRSFIGIGLHFLSSLQ